MPRLSYRRRLMLRKLLRVLGIVLAAAIVIGAALLLYLEPYVTYDRDGAHLSPKICQITGKKAMIGNNVSHSKRRTKRTFDVNLFTKKFYYVEQDCWISLNICANGLRVINKKGLDAALNDAVAKGYCDWKSIRIIA